jgi:hypothetical protein
MLLLKYFASSNEIVIGISKIFILGYFAVTDSNIIYRRHAGKVSSSSNTSLTCNREVPSSKIVPNIGYPECFFFSWFSSLPPDKCRNGA